MSMFARWSAGHYRKSDSFALYVTEGDSVKLRVGKVKQSKLLFCPMEWISTNFASLASRDGLR